MAFRSQCKGVNPAGSVCLARVGGGGRGGEHKVCNQGEGQHDCAGMCACKNQHKRNKAHISQMPVGADWEEKEMLGELTEYDGGRVVGTERGVGDELAEVGGTMSAGKRLAESGLGRRRRC